MLIPRARAGSSGVTLIELVIAITILGIAISMGLPSYNQWIQNTRLRNGAESILRGLELARSEAIRRNAPVRLTLTTAGSDVVSGWTVGCITSTSTCPANIQSRNTGDGSSNAIVVTTGSTQFNFSGLGRAGSAATINVDSTALDPADSRDLRIVVNINGMARLCDPNVTSETDTRKCP